MRRALLLIVGVAVGAARAPAQEATNPHDAQPERPTVATHAYTVWPGWVEVEAGIETDRFDAGVHAFSTPIALKVGLAPRVQLEISDAWMRNTSVGPARDGGGDLAVAVKWRIADSLPVLGSFAVLPALKLPTGSVSDGLGTGSTDARLTLISSHQIGPVELDINAGFTLRASTAHAPRTATLWTVSAGAPVSGILGWTAEVYGYPGTGGPSGSAPIVAVLTGPVFTVRRWAELDTGVILPLDGPQAYAFYAGGTWNFGRLW
ncbi:MAG TPA: hypothetical protein VIC24_14715 [Gemmatimonadaceae bacterium]|jgi:hypothetical protein